MTSRKLLFSTAALLGSILATSRSNAEIVLTEWMANPATLSDDFGEYFEVYNSGVNPVAIDGWTIRDDGSDSFTIGGTGISINPGEFFVFGDSENTDTPSYVDFAWVEGAFFLANGADEIIIEDSGANTVVSMFYSNGDPFGAGTSAVLNNIGSDDSDEANFLAEAFSIDSFTGTGNPDLGSPGAAGSTAVPEPGSLIVLGAVGLVGLVRRRRQAP